MAGLADLMALPKYPQFAEAHQALQALRTPLMNQYKALRNQAQATAVAGPHRGDAMSAFLSQYGKEKDYLMANSGYANAYNAFQNNPLFAPFFKARGSGQAQGPAGMTSSSVVPPSIQNIVNSHLYGGASPGMAQSPAGTMPPTAPMANNPASFALGGTPPSQNPGESLQQYAARLYQIQGGRSDGPYSTFMSTRPFGEANLDPNFTYGPQGRSMYQTGAAQNNGATWPGGLATLLANRPPY